MNSINKTIEPEDLSTQIKELEDIHQRMDRNNYTYEINTNGTKKINIGSKYASPLVDIDKFVHKVLSTKDLAFEINIRLNGVFEVKKLALAKYYDCIIAYQSCYSDVYWYSEHVELFFRCVKSLGLWGYPLAKPHLDSTMSGKPDAQLFNDLINLIRIEAKKTDFKCKLQRRINNSLGNYLSAKTYIAALFEKYSKLLVLRLDPGYQDYIKKSVSIEDIQRHIRSFFNNWRSNKLFEKCVGYIWKLEMGDMHGFHCHLVLFFNGQDHEDDEFIAKKISDYWEIVITKGEGHCPNSNQEIKRYERENRNISIGMIDHHDLVKRGFLLDNIRYITKTDQYIKLKSSIKTRTFGRGAMPELLDTPLGRPRIKDSCVITEPEKLIKINQSNQI